MNSNKVLNIAVVQMAAGDEVGENLESLKGFVKGLSGVDLVALPEVFAFRGSESDYREIAEPLNGPIVSFIAGLAKKMGCWFLAGSISESAGDNVFNTSVLINRSGGLAGAYRKMHLFEACLDDGTVIREADAYDPGKSPVMVEIEGWKAGLSICYDLRFPELYREYSSDGADMVFVASNFTQKTGKDHWETLLRARAIENQCFVVGVNQCGRNPVTEVESYGNSMVVGPWGDVLCRAGDMPEILKVKLEMDEIKKTRARIPALKHRKL